MLCNLFDAAWSNMIGNVGEAEHEQNRTGSEEVAATATASWAVIAAWSGTGRSGSTRGSDAHDGVAVERAATSRWIGWAEESSARSTLGARAGAAARGDAGAEGRSIGRGFSHGSVDAAAGRTAHRAALWARVQREPGVAHPRLARLLLPTTLGPSARAQRVGDQALEADTLAGSKKNAEKQGRIIVFIDESGLSERPTRVRTWAPRGQTPVLQFHFNWKHVSAVAGLTRSNFLFRLYDGAVKSAQIVEFLKALRAQLKR